MGLPNEKNCVHAIMENLIYLCELDHLNLITFSLIHIQLFPHSFC